MTDDEYDAAEREYWERELDREPAERQPPEPPPARWPGDTIWRVTARAD
jgi:hypothetical protein